ncbi:Phosphatidylinositol 4-kinase beta [Seminavis robusta]|uniref:1-phosphatidylinositol 4-kinase n=1 Tax=Seminavis robusta TaxID=568900 RepID=A0A9N8DDD7_9STRA|nr:Phosphatidylinositol 4-kinase beta [Seminavis robusta]|eukprot:Sro87_g045940.1 Phosphatidylinositol 4-kinase beta (1380) ;mRNA; r:10932-15149
MPFLIPALLSGVCDALILVLQEHRLETLWLLEDESASLLLDNNNGTSNETYYNPHHHHRHHYDTNLEESLSASSLASITVHRVQYLAIIAVVRLLLLLFPLPYHSYTGTAIRFPVFYHYLYGMTLAAVILHMLALSMIDPDSLATLAGIHHRKEGTLPPEEDSEDLWQQETELATQDMLNRSCWWILFLSLISVCSHIVMLIHVRSTAPSPSYFSFSGGKKKKLVYYYNQWRNVNSSNTSQLDPEQPQPLLSQQPTEEEGRNPVVPMTPENNGNNLKRDIPTSPIHKLSSQYDEFMSEMQNQISGLKKDWTHKLDDFTQRHLRSLSGGAGGSRNAMQHNPLLPLTPFRVLLQLFAYEDVIDSGKLDAVFDMDQGQSLTFFVPQLLSFLLHGAYYEADPTKLEQWILDKCERHAHFAHRCYWFLRAWSLEQPAYHPTTNNSTSPFQQYSPGNSTASLQQQGTTPSNNNHQHRRNQSSEEDAAFILSTPPPTDAGRRSRSSSFASIGGAVGNATHQKLLPEERAVVEGLLLKVVQKGGAAARILQYGRPNHKVTDERNGGTPQKNGKKKRRGKRDKVVPRNGTSKPETQQQQANPGEPIPAGIFWDEDVCIGSDKNYKDDTDLEENQPMSSTSLVSELVLTPEMEASLPVDPNTGFPSHRHLDALMVSHRYGFVPLVTAKREREQSMVPTSTPASSDSFQATPRFLDALLSMADGLFLVPREQRKRELRRQLQNIEVEMLPSNAVYVPISNVYHRVWRIVSEESIALNTKERVPCIILLEVVDYENDLQRKVDKANISDDEESTDELDDVTEPWDSKRSKEKRTLELPKLGIAKKKTRKADAPISDSNNLQAPTLPGSAASAFSLPYYTLMGGMTEAEIVNHWRFAKRDPHRGESILDKIALPLDMNRMKEKIHQLRDKQEAILHDLLHMTMPDDQKHNAGKQSAVEQPDHTSASLEHDTEVAAFLCNDAYEGTKMLGRSAVTTEQDEHARDLSPDRHPTPASMGQWSSPISGRRRTILLDDLETVVAGNSSGQDNDNLTPAAYGSTYQGRGKGNGTNGLPPRPDSRVGDTTDSPNRGAKYTSAKNQPHKVIFRENWQAKEERLRKKSAFGTHRGWRVLPILVKANDDLRQEQLASQLIQRMAFILARERVPVWLCPYEIIAITDTGGIMEAIPDTISLDSLKRNDPNFIDLKAFFHSFFGDNIEDLADAKSNFVESLAAYSIVTFLLQIKDRHNGNILLDNRGHIIHIDFGFFFLSSPGKNTGFESAPFKLTRDFVEVLGGPDSHAFRTFRELCVRSFLVLRRHCMEIILLVEMLKAGNEDLACFRGRPDDAIKGLRERFRLDLSDRACREYVHALIDESLENWRTNWYDRYQKYCVGVL